MSGRIDPLLPGDDGDGSPRASVAVDVTALFELHRVRLLRLATAITLDRLLADDVVSDAFLSLQRHIGTVDDPVAHLQRTVVELATAPATGLTPRSRRKVAARRPHPVAPRFDHLDHVATWEALTTMSGRERAVLVLAHWRGLDEVDIAEALGWPRRTVSRHLHGARADIGRRSSGAGPPGERAASMLAVAMPQLVDGEEPAVDDVPADHTPTGRTALRLFVPKEPKRHRVAWMVAVVLLLAAMVGTVTFFSQQQGDLLPLTETSTPDEAELVQPEWYVALRPHVPDRFDRLALVALDADRIGYVAIESSSGRSLEIEIVRPHEVPASEPSVGVVDVPGGFRLLREDGSSVEVSCSLCATSADAESPADAPNVRAIASRIAAGFELDDVDSGFGSPSEMRTDFANVASAVASLPGAPTVKDPSTSDPPPAPGPAAAVDGERFDGGATGGVVESVTTQDDMMTILVVHGVFPAPPDVLRPPITSYRSGLVAGWVIDPDGTATRVVTTAPESPSVEAVTSPVESLLDALGEIGASA